MAPGAAASRIESAQTGTRAVLTYREHAGLPDDGRRDEIHDGELSRTPAPTPRHRDAVGVFMPRGRPTSNVTAAAVSASRRSTPILGDTSIVQPDVVDLAADGVPPVRERGIEGAPTPAVDVLSSATAVNDRRTKMQRYARHRVPYYRLLDPLARIVEAYTLGCGGYDPGVRAIAGGVSPPNRSAIGRSARRPSGRPERG